MSDPNVLADRYVSFMNRADRIQTAIDAIGAAEPDREMLAMMASLKARKETILADCNIIKEELLLFFREEDDE